MIFRSPLDGFSDFYDFYGFYDFYDYSDLTLCAILYALC